MKPSELYCLHQAGLCWEIAQRFAALNQPAAMGIWIDAYNAFLRDARKFKDGVNHA